MSTAAPPIDPAALTPGRAARAFRRVPSGVVSLGPALMAVALAMMVAVLHWKGLDQAAQSYRVLQVRTHGLALWDSGWYGGNYPLGYSLVFPVVGAVVGLPVASAASAAGASWAFDRLVTPAFGRRPLGVWYFAASTILAVSIGQLPFLAGEALGMGALVALTRHRRIAALVLVVAAASCSPLAAAFTVLACAAWFRHRRDLRRGIGSVAAAALAVIAGLGLLFPGTGPFPFPWATLLISLSTCVLLATSVFRTTPVLRTGAALYAIASLASFVVPNPVGGNAPRLAATVGIPLLFCLATAPGRAPFSFFTETPAWADPARWPVGRWWRPALLAGSLGALAVWQWAPGMGVVTSPASDPAEAASYYQPVVHQIEVRSHGPERVEIPPTREHWEAAWVAPAVPLARGWERQLDIADNPIFYQRGTLDPASYRRWLVTNGVSWVALPATALDYAGADEGGLLRAGEVPGLHLVWSNRDWKLWRVTGSPGLVSGPAVLAALAPDGIHLTFFHPGSVTLRVRYSSFSAVTDGSACVQPDRAGWTTVKAGATGAVTLGTSVFAHHASVCAPRGGA